MKRPTMFIERGEIVLRVTQLLKEEFEEVTGLKMFTNGVIVCESEIQPFIYHNETYLNPKPSNSTTGQSIQDILFSGWTAASRELIEKRNIRHGWWEDDFKKRFE